MDQTIIVTGAAGFIGSHLCERLIGLGHRVVGIDNFCDFYARDIKKRNLTELAKSDAFELAELDIRERNAVLALFEKHRPTGVIHLAAMAGVRPSIENPAYYTAVNLDGTVNLLDGAVGVKCKRFCFASSSSVYGNNEKTPFAEDDPVEHPISPYAATKRSGELICHSYHHLNDLPIACLRFFTVFGPRQRPDLAINKFIRLIDAGESIPMFGDGTTSRDYTFIEDIVSGVVAAYDRIDAFGYRIWNLGGEHPVTLKEMIETIARVVGKEAIIDQQPMQPGDVDRTWADIARSKAELGYEPTTSFEAGVEAQWAWYQTLKD